MEGEEQKTYIEIERKRKGARLKATKERYLKLCFDTSDSTNKLDTPDPLSLSRCTEAKNRLSD